MVDTTGRTRPTVRAKVDNAALMKRRDSRDSQQRPPAVPRKIVAAAELLAVQPHQIDYEEMARQVGYSNAHALRRALALPQSIRFLRDFKRERLEQINLANPEALRSIRDQSGNDMARVAATRQLELMGERMDDTAPGRGQQQTPGVTIIIEAPGQPREVIGPQPPVIEIPARPPGHADKSTL
jgi:hypothetical protein